PQLGVLNYLLSFVGIGPQEWIYAQTSVIPSLVLVEAWQWTPLIMLIVLGGLAAVPREPYESAEIDVANVWQKFRIDAADNHGNHQERSDHRQRQIA
ncbi:carbohydrate ABC transporter permease, partial [Rhizobium ruizarguesonis]